MVMQHPGPLLIDLQAQRLFSWLATPWLTDASLLLAEVGDKAGIITLVAPWALWLLLVKRIDLLAHGAQPDVGHHIKAVFMGWACLPDYLVRSFSYPGAIPPHGLWWWVYGSLCRVTAAETKADVGICAVPSRSQ